ncbi:ImmA/IrrE family metallo-endopeptidase [Mycobacterium numidiamassiliense]|uniref:ImmA/IrrE family metallo-endopeptidase n=1 Tax=Mycobacterium numidiamassiliense TaxID=1841861 RepID=UPI00157BD1F7|nr:ImmA/IrrE family metallo-endopeptidase [Mycobacterium numidiamassiliense]
MVDGAIVVTVVVKIVVGPASSFDDPAERSVFLAAPFAQLFGNLVETCHCPSGDPDERKCGLGGQQEDEADWLSGEMLIPYDGAFRLARANPTDQQAADLFDVSLAVARWRMNHGGARKVVEPTRSKWASPATQRW